MIKFFIGLIVGVIIRDLITPLPNPTLDTSERVTNYFPIQYPCKNCGHANLDHLDLLFGESSTYCVGGDIVKNCECTHYEGII